MITIPMTLPCSQPGKAVVHSEQELATALASPLADLILMPRTLPLRLDSQMRRAPLAEHRTQLTTGQEETAVAELLLKSGLDDAILRSDIVTSIQLFARVFNRRSVGLRLEITDEQSCPKFHCDNVHARMLVTYFGPTTEYIVDSHPDQILHAPLYSRVFLKGLRHPTCQKRILHRSPAIAPGEKRLVFVLDFDDWLSVC